MTHKLMSVFSPYDVRDYAISKTIDASKLPEHFELPMPAVKNQRTTNSCVAHACALLVEYHNGRQQDNKDEFSTQFIYGYRPNGYYVGEGMYIRDALNTIRKQGDCKREIMPGNAEYKEAMVSVEKKLDAALDYAYPNRVSTYIKLSTNNDIKTALMDFGPVVVSMPWGSAMTLDSDHVIHNTLNDVDGYHCVIIYGWNEKGWLMQNSWGTTWGDKGRCIVPFDFTFKEAWGVSDEIINDNVKRPITNFFIKLFYKLINAIRRWKEK